MPVKLYNLANVDRKLLNDENSWQWKLNFAGAYMQHNYYVYYVVDQIMRENEDLKAIVEIGTGNGALTTVLGLWGVRRKIPVLTVDHGKMFNDSIFECLHIHYACEDEFGEEFKDILKAYTQGFTEKIFLICDGGDKIREFNLWAPQMASGTIIAVHDWTVEVPYDAIKQTSDKYCTEYHKERWNKMNCQFATFKVR
jgi:hypothetical protein